VIIDSQILSLLLKGTDRQVPEEGDSQIRMPNLIMMTVPPVQPMIALVGSGGSGNQSYYSNVANTLTNGAGSSSILATLQPGLYTLDLHLAARFNYTVTGAILCDASLNIFDGTSSNTILGLYAFIGAFSVNTKISMLLNKSFSIRLSSVTNGAGQTMDYNGSVLVTRHL
jgi:hypothetical protein